MIKSLTIILLLSVNISFAQVKPQPTQFDKFVSRSKIEWAAYASDTFNFDHAGLNNLLLERMMKKKIKGSLPIASRTDDINSIKYLPMDSIDRYFHYGTDPVPAETIMPKTDRSKFNLTEVTQILYVEKGRLKSYIPFVTPTLPVFLSSGNYLGERFYFNTCYNYKYCKKPRKESKLIFLSKTKRMIALNAVEQNDKLKEMYGKNLLEALWPQIMNDEIAIFTPDNSRKIKPEELNNSFSAGGHVLVPLYDSTATVYKYEVAGLSAGVKGFTNIELIQDWYYDAERNKVTNIIREALLYARTWKGNEEAKEAAAVLKLVFK
jgi:hypothetical protein